MANCYKALDLVWGDDPNETLLPDNFSYTYTAKLIGVELSVTGLITGESVGVNYTNDGLVSSTSNYASGSGTTPNLSSISKHYFASINASEGSTPSYYAIKATSLNNSNYHINPLSTKTKSWAIVKKTLGLGFTYTSTQQVTYDGSNHGIILTVSNIQANSSSVYDELTLTYTASSGLTCSTLVSGTTLISNTTYTFYAKNVLSGGYTLSITAIGGAAKDNYKATLPAQSTLDIVPLSLNVTWHGDTKAGAPSFDSNFETTYSGIERYVYADPTNKVAGDTIGFLYQNNTYTNASSTAYQASITQITGESANNYELSVSAQQARSWKINPREITISWLDYVDGNVRYKTTGYTAGQAGDIKVVINNIVTGETLPESVTYENAGGLPVLSPTNAGEYTATIGLTLGTNYVWASGASNKLGFKIYPYVISGSSLEWEYVITKAGLSPTVKAHTWGTPVTFVDSTSYHNFNVTSVDDTLVQNVTISTETYYGLCTCGLEATNISNVHINHQWPDPNQLPTNPKYVDLPNSGPMHAGKYWLTLNISGSNAANYVFDALDDGYSNATYFDDNSGVGPVKLKYPQITPTTFVHDIELTDLTQNSSTFGEIKTKYVLTFTINKKVQGFNPGSSVLDYTESYLGKYYRHEPYSSLPPASVLVDVTKRLDPSSGYTSLGTYTLTQYRNQPNNVKDVGDYEIHFYDTSGGSGGSDCDNEFGTVSSIALTVLILPKIIILDTYGNGKKEYDTTTVYQGFTAPTGSVAPASALWYDGLKITGDTVNYSAAYNSKDVVSADEIEFILTGTSAANYIVHLGDFTYFNDYRNPDDIEGAVDDVKTILTTSDITDLGITLKQ